MIIYALLKGIGATNTFHGITSDDNAAETWFAGSDQNFFKSFESFGDDTFHEVKAEPIVYDGDTE